MEKEELKKILQSPEKSAFVKNYSNILDLVEKELLIDAYDNTITVPQVEKLKVFIGQVIEIYEEMWDLAIVYNNSGKAQFLGIDILFNEFTIKNSSGRSHDIKEFYLRLVLQSTTTDKLYFSRIQGARGTVTVKEYSCGYQHSHLPSVVYGKAVTGPLFDTFCTGSGTINRLISRYNDFNEVEDVEQICLALYTMVMWESLEGTPHFRMERIRYMGGSGSTDSIRTLSVSYGTSSSFSAEVLEMIRIGKIPVKELKAHVINNKIRLDIPESFIKRLINNPELKNYVGVEYNGAVVEEDSLVEYLKNLTNGVPNGITIPEIEKKTGYFFNGKEVHLKFSDYNPDQGKGQSKKIEIIYKIPEQYVNKFKQDAEQEIHEQQVRGAAAERYA